MTDSTSSQSAYWATLDRCLHQHHAVIAGDLRLQAAHAAFQLQLATLRALHPLPGTGLPNGRPSATASLRASLEFLLREIFANILEPAFGDALQKPDFAAILPQHQELDHATLLLLAEDTVRYLRDNPTLWTRFGLAALQVRALADLQHAYALETGALLPSGDAGDRECLTTAEIGRLIHQELDPLVQAHAIGAPAFVADYQRTRQPRASVETTPPARRTRARFAFPFRKRVELSLPN